jgi:hypothetical protein
MERDHTRVHRLAAIVAIAVLVRAATVLPAGAAAPDGAATITCTNPASGVAWQIAVDPSRATVDANPARFSPGEISWFDPKDGGNYTLDRKSGELVAGVASSTGGYFRRARCNMENSR